MSLSPRAPRGPAELPVVYELASSRRLDVMSAVERLVLRQLVWRGARSHFVQVRDSRLHVLDVVGRGRMAPLATIHGFSAAAATQYGTFILKYLRPHFSRIVAPDLPGHGASGIPLEGLTSDTLVEGVTEALSAVLDRPAFLFATSLGGAVAVRYAVRHPQRVAGLILCSPAGAPCDDAQLRALRQSFRVQSHSQALAFVDRLFPAPHPMRHLYAFGIRHQFGRRHLADLLMALGPETFLTPTELGSLSMPILLLWGGAERVLPRQHLDYFRRHLPPHARIECPPDYGHAPFLDRAPDVARRIISFAARASQEVPRVGRRAI